MKNMIGLVTAGATKYLRRFQLLRPEADSPVKPILSRVIDLISRGIVEGRAVLQGLRSSNFLSTSLEKALCDLGNEYSTDDGARFRILVMGQPTELDASIREQIYLITREALLNVLRHSEATIIEAELEYLPRKLRVVVRDIGSDINPQALHSARTSHWGLLGMRERAASIGAQLRLWTSPGAGTELEISVPIAITLPRYRTK